MEFAVHITTHPFAHRPQAVPLDHAPAAVDPEALCWWCGLEVDPRWPADHPAAPLVAATPARPAVPGAWPEHRFCADSVNRPFDSADPRASAPVRRARLAFAVRLASADGRARARAWRRFERGGDPHRTRVAHLRSLLRLGVRPRADEVVAVLLGPLNRRLYAARMRRWAVVAGSVLAVSRPPQV
ncbi:hypothetical protein LZG04_28425 [Saccharothrix sp. S26]|uniref:hypothetical protein n=1 Tax=Saccharothrix sp. S26 TaxID=2907215 RepID=UPI001F3FA8A7|nr:hypothetical protein [Saccharothrix sp. S26]MCE6998693.1 hypothetical protein [Saccharothrix sp. S26]